MSRVLYIIGNGFDLHHKIESSYWHFGTYLKNDDGKTFAVVERYFDVDDIDFWGEFEARLATLNIDTLEDDASDFLTSYASEDWSEGDNHHYQEEISEIVGVISTTLRQRFAEWIRDLDIPDKADIAALILPLDTTAIYLNFNYTSSLQNIYGIPDANIFHVHGSAADPDEQLILGHGWKAPPRPKKVREPDDDLYEDDPDETDFRVVEGQSIINRYFKDTFKPTKRILADNAAFFTGLSDVTSIIVLGHSISEVDHPYFMELIRNIAVDKVRWKISYHGDQATIQEKFEVLGVDPQLVEYLTIGELKAP